jgi:hypothetical protein
MKFIFSLVNRMTALSGADYTPALCFDLLFYKTILREEVMKYCVALLLFLSPMIQAAEWKEISGMYAVTPENYLDPSEKEMKDSHYRFRLMGRSAKDLYEAMKIKPAPDECTGGVAKTQGEMRCIFYEKEKLYECNFSINIGEQKIEYGVAC